MLTYFAFKILPAILALLYTLYLLHVRRNPAKREAILRKYAPGTPAQEIYSRVYTDKYLAGWILLTAWFVFGIDLDIYKVKHTHPSLFVAIVALVVSIALGTAGTYYWGAALQNRSHRTNAKGSDWINPAQ